MTRTRLMAAVAGLAAGTITGIAGAAAGFAPDKHTETKTDRTVEMITLDNGDKYEVIIRGDETIAKVNGIRVVDDLVKVKGDRVIIYGDDGKVLKEFTLARVGGARALAAPQAPNAPLPGLRLRQSTRDWSQGETSRGLTIVPRNSQDKVIDLTTEQREEIERAMAAERPPVMLGVLLDAPGEALRAQLGVSEYAVLLVGVLDDLPAEKAGLEKYDIIVAVNGEKIDRPGLIREVLMDSEPGDELAFTVIRAGKKIERKLELEAYDEDKLSTPGVSMSYEITPGAEGRFPLRANQWQQGLRWEQGDNENAKRSIEEALRSLESLGQDEEALARVREQMERMKQQLFAQGESLRNNGRAMLDNRGRLILDDDERDEMVGDLEHRLDTLESQLEERLAALEERLDDRWGRMEESIGRLFDRFEQMLDDARRDDE